MMEYKVTRAAPDELKHWGIKGQKWGVRRYENEDGTLTEAGKKRYAKSVENAKGEKISGKQMVKNAVRRGAIGAVAGSSIAQLADRINVKKEFEDATKPDFFKVKTTDDIAGYTWNDYKKSTTSEGHPLWKTSGFIPSVYGDASKYNYNNHVTKDRMEIVEGSGTIYGVSTQFKNRGSAFHFGEVMTKSLLSAPLKGVLIGAGAGALGSVAVDKLHNVKIDRAKKFVERYTSSYQKTIAVERALDARVKAYKKEHPNSTLNEKEMKEMLRHS